MSNKAIDKDYLLTQLKNFDSKILSETYLNQANIWEGTAEELETQQSSIPNESLLLVNNDGMGGVVLDAELSTTSENAIQNKAVANALATVPTLKDTIDTASDTRDADTLEGHAANYFATQTSVTSINDSLNALTKHTSSVGTNTSNVTSGNCAFYRDGNICTIVVRITTASSVTSAGQLWSIPSGFEPRYDVDILDTNSKIRLFANASSNEFHVVDELTSAKVLRGVFTYVAKQ